MALRVFTAEFGMGSGAWPLAMATRPAPAQPAPGWNRGAGAGNRVCHVVRAKCLGEAASGPRWRGGFGFCRCTRAASGFKRRSSD